MPIGIGNFKPGIDLMAWTVVVQRRVCVDLIVVVRIPSEGWRSQAKRPEPAHLQPPPGAQYGGGISIGPHVLRFYRPGNELTLDGMPLIEVENFNVVMLAAGDSTLSIVGTEVVPRDLGSAPSLQDSGDYFRTLDYPGQFAQLLAGSAPVQAFISST